MTDLNITPPVDTTHYVCHGFRAINGAFRHRGEVFDATGVRNMETLEEMALVSRTSSTAPVIEVEYDGQVRTFSNEEYADAFIAWVALQEEAEPTEEVIVSEEAESQYVTMTKAHLCDLLAARSIDFKAAMNKDELIALLEAADVADAEAAAIASAGNDANDDGAGNDGDAVPE